GPNFAGLFTLDLPPSVVKGQEFDIIVRRVATRRNREQVEIAVARVAEAAPLHVTNVARATSPHPGPEHVTRLVLGEHEEGLVRSEGTGEATHAARKDPGNWRYVIGTFQIKIPVTTGDVMLFPEKTHTFKTRERGIGEIALRACRERFPVSVYVAA